MQFPLNTYFWPETEIGSTATLPCGLGPLVTNGMARSTCNPDTAQFDPVFLDECFTCEFIHQADTSFHKCCTVTVILIEWETDNLIVLESLPNTTLCASVVNPDVNINDEVVQLQVLTLSSTAQGSIK